jgi:uncharacterized protein
VYVARLSLSPLKGGARVHPTSLRVTGAGAVGDRRFCFVDPAAGRVLRTVENPALLGLRVRVEVSAPTDTLHVDIPGRGIVSGPVAPGERIEADYWGRCPALHLLHGPWADAVGDWLGRPVVLARAEPGDVVYSGAVTVVTTSSVAEAARRAGTALPSYEALLTEADRWRANVVVDTGAEPPFVEDAWVGRTVRLGGVLLFARACVPRCAVVGHHPGTGAREVVDPLAVLAPDRSGSGEVVFGLDCDVREPGEVRVADPVELSGPGSGPTRWSDGR